MMNKQPQTDLSSASGVSKTGTEPRERRRSSADTQIRELVNVGVALSHERDSATLLELIVSAARRLTGADAGTLYVVDKSTQTLHFKILQNETLGTRINAVKDGGVAIPPPVPLFIEGEQNLANVSSSVALSGKTVNIPDVYQAEGYNFSGVKSYDAASGYHSKSMLVVPMRDHENEIIGVLQLLNAVDPDSRAFVPFSENDAYLVTSLASQAAVAITQKRLIEQLSEAYVKTERSNVELKTELQTSTSVRRFGMIFSVCLLIAGGAAYAYFFDQNLLVALRQPVEISEKSPAYGEQGRPVVTVPVERRRMTTTVALTGQVEPLKQMNVVSPFTGKVLERSFEFGQTVTEGDILLRLDTTELQVQLREVTAAYMKEQERLNEITNWDKHRDVTQARTNEIRAKASLATAKRKLEETNVLFEKGIVSKMELEAAAEAHENQILGLRTAQEDLASTLKRGDANAVRIAEMSLRNARTRLDEVSGRIAQAEIRAIQNQIIQHEQKKAARLKGTLAANEQMLDEERRRAAEYSQLMAKEQARAAQYSQLADEERLKAAEAEKLAEQERLKALEAERVADSLRIEAKKRQEEARNKLNALQSKLIQVT
ncbi:MAG TPA: GAF domain-containing protein, partial [Candidatus Ozemobacteraceae bacterium]|nr:GAF domain-containing protein [Candidatus Ozemobacteraceae bacterium]